jgi:hypothetical protein
MKQSGAHGGVIAPVLVDPVTGLNALRVDPIAIRHAEHTLAVNGAFARTRLGFDELVFVQLDPLVDTRIARMAVVRYTRERSIERVKANDEFLTTLETALQAAGRRESSTRGLFPKLAQEAQAPEGTGWSAVVEAEVEIAIYHGDRAALVFVTTSSTEMLGAGQGKLDSVTLFPQLEVTLPTLALADLLAMWKDLTEGGS